jgi:uncharacterized protein (PEP-CTERM system associated)
VVFGGYTYYTLYALESRFRFQNHSEEQFFLSAGLEWNPAVTVGIRGALASVNYSQNVKPDSLDFNFGPYVEARLTQYLNLTAEAGYQGDRLSGTGLNRDSAQLSTYYARVELSHRLNRYWTERLVAGREAQLGFTTNYTEVTYLSHIANWRVNSRLTLNLRAFYEHGVDSPGSPHAEKVDRFGCSFSFERKLGKELSLRCAYEFINRASNQPDRSYYQNRVLLGIAYVF